MRALECSIFMDIYDSVIVHGWREENMMKQNGGNFMTLPTKESIEDYINSRESSRDII